MHNAIRSMLSYSLIVLLLSSAASAQSRQAPPEMFKDLDDQLLGDALILHGKQLFIDDFVIGDMKHVQKKLNQPVKHPKNPVLIRDQS